MKILAFDTANNTCSVALLCDDKVMAYASETSPAKQAERLFPLIEQVFTSSGYSYNDIDIIAVTIGPGSFTGIRIGLATARGIALASGIPLLGVNTLEALAHDIFRENPNDTFPLLVALDARRQQLYIQLFASSGETLTSPKLISYDEIRQHLPDTPFSVTGNGVTHIESPLSENKTQHSCHDLMLPDARSIAYLVAQKHSSLPASKHGNNDVFPLYIRKPDAKKSQKLKI